MDQVNKRYDFVIFFDVQDGNPNGDPDAGNLPRIDAETGMGLVTDVCLKRKVRNYVALTKNYHRPYDIYIKEKAVLGKSHWEAFENLGIPLGQESRNLIPKELEDAINDLALPEGLKIVEEDNQSLLVVEASADVKLIKDLIKDMNLGKEVKKFIDNVLKGSKARKPTAEETEKGREWMCKNFYDIRTFGAVLSLKTAPNCGQVRGPVQLTFARSVEPIVALEHSITRMAVATEAEAERQSGDNRTMGRKFTVPYALYRAHGFISAHLAAQTGFSQEDLDLFWEALVNMFEHDRSAARGMMCTRAVVAFEHQSALGNKPAYELFSRVNAERVSEGPARSFSDYRIALDSEPLKQVFNIITVTN